MSVNLNMSYGTLRYIYIYICLLTSTNMHKYSNLGMYVFLSLKLGYNNRKYRPKTT